VSRTEATLIYILLAISIGCHVVAGLIVFGVIVP